MSEKHPYPEPPPAYADTQHPPYSVNQGGPNYPQPPPTVPYATVPPVTTTTTTVIVRPHIPLNTYPVNMQCPHCHAQIVTAINYITGTLTWIICIVLVILGLFCGCCLIPFCIRECQDVEHRCPNCSRVIGVYQRI